MSDSAYPFAGPEAFRSFHKEVSTTSRYLRSRSGEDFLRAVAASCKRPVRSFSEGETFWRAQVGHQWIVAEDLEHRIPGPHPEARMRPLQDRAYEGRVNPKGIPCLYLATTRQVAVSEVRPWLGSVVSVARFSLDRVVRVVDCSASGGATPAGSGPRDAVDVESAVWADIDVAYSRPVTRSDNTAEYSTTQVLAEAFREQGYDGVVYRSAFSAEGVNIALFDINCARLVDMSLFAVSNARFEFVELTDHVEPDSA